MMETPAEIVSALAIVLLGSASLDPLDAENVACTL